MKEDISIPGLGLDVESVPWNKPGSYRCGVGGQNCQWFRNNSPANFKVLFLSSRAIGSSVRRKFLIIGYLKSWHFASAPEVPIIQHLHNIRPAFISYLIVLWTTFLINHNKGMVFWRYFS
jgi:hypothetical protein